MYEYLLPTSLLSHLRALRICVAFKKEKATDLKAVATQFWKDCKEHCTYSDHDLVPWSMEAVWNTQQAAAMPSGPIAAHTRGGITAAQLREHKFKVGAAVCKSDDLKNKRDYPLGPPVCAHQRLQRGAADGHLGICR